tara:strand:+ start:467 stop:1570 length:1104 start_codon:yes stop_codon:yes gene_type:complete
MFFDKLNISESKMLKPQTSKKISINKNLTISNSSKCLIVAEISANHGGSLKILKKTILKAKEIGADAVKIQTYEASTMTLNCKNRNFFIDDNSIWKGKYLFDLYKKAETPFKWHKEIFDFAKKNKVLLFSAPFDLTAVKLLQDLKCPLYKIASPEIQDLELIKKVSSTGKPIIISTGIANEKDISNALKICHKNKNSKIILLNCISSYPSRNNELNLNYINKLKKYSNLVGYSDHSMSDLPSIISVSLGAKVIEKHFVLNNKIKSPDVKFSYNPKEFKNLIMNIRIAEQMFGGENINKKYILRKKLKTITRSLFYIKDIKKGDKITKKHIRSIRPGTGLPLEHYEKVIGKKIKKDRFRGQPVQKKDF